MLMCFGKPMQSILAPVLISCQGVPYAISIPFYFSWASLMQNQYILWQNRCTQEQSLTNSVVVTCLLITILVVIICRTIYTDPLCAMNKIRLLMLPDSFILVVSIFQVTWNVLKTDLIKSMAHLFVNMNIKWPQIFNAKIILLAWCSASWEKSNLFKISLREFYLVP